MNPRFQAIAMGTLFAAIVGWVLHVGRDVLVRGRTIERIAPAGSIPPGAEPGATIIPGGGRVLIEEAAKYRDRIKHLRDQLLGR